MLSADQLVNVHNVLKVFIYQQELNIHKIAQSDLKSNFYHMM